MTPGAEIEPGPHWWKASALTTRPTLPLVERGVFTPSKHIDGIAVFSSSRISKEKHYSYNVAFDIGMNTTDS